MKQEILHGDCLELMKSIADNSVDAVVTDPPYGLSFMGSKWDYDVPNIEIWKECLRVLKPGGYLLAFAGTRTQHRMAVRIEDAGFEIRDMIAWVYGSGFPKSLNIGKAVDKLQGNEREIIEINDGRSRYDGATRRERDEDNRQISTGKDRVDFTKDISEWEGWGTALKPALEPITVARKPLSEKTVAENCLKWGTGGINIDECRVETEDDNSHKPSSMDNQNCYGDYAYPIGGKGNPYGRFPANLIHDGSDEVTGLFPDTKSGAMKKPYKYTNNGYSLGKPTGETKQIHESSEGSAARFFYCPKASKSERNKGCDGMENKRGIDNYRPNDDGGNGIQSRLHGAANKGSNHHPTVKPIALMEYLIKLVSREGAVILDPFGGSGTTALACINLDRQFIIMERDEQYIEIIKKRVEKLNKKPKQKTLF
jgi:DNA modification methylase